MDLYFNDTGDGDASTLANWFEDAGFTAPAAALPTTNDNLYFNAAYPAVDSANTLGSATFGAVSLAAAGTWSWQISCDTMTAESGAVIDNTITATTSVTLNTGSTLGSSVTTPNLIINGGEATESTGLTGSVTMTSGTLNGTISGNVTASGGEIGQEHATSVAGTGTLSGTATGGLLSTFAAVNLSGSAKMYGHTQGAITAPATDNGDGTWGYAPGGLGRFGSLRLTGIPAGGGNSNVYGLPV